MTRDLYFAPWGPDVVTLQAFLDVFSRYVVGWMVAHRESATLAGRFVRETCARQRPIHSEETRAVINLTNDEAELLRKLEEELWREETRFNQQRMDEVIAEDFFEFGRSGRVYRREDTLAIPRAPIHAEFPLPHFKARLLGRDVAQVTYNSAVTYDGVVYHARRSSIWSRAGAGWLLRFHQGTPFNEGA